MTRSLLLGLLLLTSCGGRYIFSATDIPQEACRRAAGDDPAVKAVLEKRAGDPNWEWQHGNQIRQVRQDAVNRCLASRGLAPKGGVERRRQE